MPYRIDPSRTDISNARMWMHYISRDMHHPDFDAEIQRLRDWLKDRSDIEAYCEQQIKKLCEERQKVWKRDAELETLKEQKKVHVDTNVQLRRLKVENDVLKMRARRDRAMLAELHRLSSMERYMPMRANKILHDMKNRFSYDLDYRRYHPNMKRMPPSWAHARDIRGAYDL